MNGKDVSNLFSHGLPEDAEIDPSKNTLRVRDVPIDQRQTIMRSTIAQAQTAQMSELLNQKQIHTPVNVDNIGLWRIARAVAALEKSFDHVQEENTQMRRIIQDVYTNTEFVRNMKECKCDEGDMVNIKDLIFKDSLEENLKPYATQEWCRAEFKNVLSDYVTVTDFHDNVATLTDVTKTITFDLIKEKVDNINVRVVGIRVHNIINLGKRHLSFRYHDNETPTVIHSIDLYITEPHVYRVYLDDMVDGVVNEYATYADCKFSGRMTNIFLSESEKPNMIIYNVDLFRDQLKDHENRISTLENGYKTEVIPKINEYGDYLEAMDTYYGAVYDPKTKKITISSIDTLTTDMTKAKTDITTINTNISGLVKADTDINTDISTIKTNMEKVVSDAADVRKDVDDAVKIVNEMKPIVDKHKDEVDAANARIDELQEAIESIDTSSTDLSSEIETIKTNITTNANDIKTLNTSLGTATNSINKNHQDIVAHGLRLDTAESNINSVRDDLSALSEKVDCIDTSSLGNVADMAQQVITNTNKLSVIESGYSNFQTQFNRLTSNDRDLSNKNNEQDLKLTNLEVRVGTIESTSWKPTVDTLTVTKNVSVGGNEKVSGNVEVLGGVNAKLDSKFDGTITANNVQCNTFKSSGNGKVEGNLDITNGLTVGGPVDITSLTMNSLTNRGDENVGGDVIVNGTLSVANANNKDISMKGPVKINGNELLTGDLTVNGNESIAGGLSVIGEGGLNVTNATILNGALTVAGATTLNGTTTAGNINCTRVSNTGNSLVGGNETISGDLIVNGTATVGTLNSTDLNTLNSATVGNKLVVVKDGSVGTDLKVGRDGFVERNLDVKGDLSITGAIAMNNVRCKQLTDTGNMDVFGNLYVAGTGSFGKTVTMADVNMSSFTDTGNGKVLGNLNVDGKTTISGHSTMSTMSCESYTTSGNGYVGGSFGVAQDELIEGSLSVGTDVSIERDTYAHRIDCTEINDSGNATIYGDVDIGGCELVRGNETVNGSMNVKGATDLDTTLNVDGATTMNGSLNVTNNQTRFVVAKNGFTTTLDVGNSSPNPTGLNSSIYVTTSGTQTWLRGLTLNAPDLGTDHYHYITMGKANAALKEMYFGFKNGTTGMGVFGLNASDDVITYTSTDVNLNRRTNVNGSRANFNITASNVNDSALSIVTNSLATTDGVLNIKATGTPTNSYVNLFNAMVPNLGANQIALISFGKAADMYARGYIGLKGNGTVTMGMHGSDQIIEYTSANVYLGRDTIVKKALTVNGATDLDGTLNVDGVTTINNSVNINPGKLGSVVNIYYPTATGAVYMNIGRGTTTTDECAHFGFDAASKQGFVGTHATGVIMRWNGGGVTSNKTIICNDNTKRYGNWTCPFQALTNDSTTSGPLFVVGKSIADGQALYIGFSQSNNRGVIGVLGYSAFAFTTAGCFIEKPLEITDTVTMAKTLTVTGLTALNGGTTTTTMTTSAAASVATTLAVGGATTLNNTLTVQSGSNKPMVIKTSLTNAMIDIFNSALPANGIMYINIGKGTTNVNDCAQFGYYNNNNGGSAFIGLHSNWNLAVLSSNSISLNRTTVITTNASSTNSLILSSPSKANYITFKGWTDKSVNMGLSGSNDAPMFYINPPGVNIAMNMYLATQLLQFCGKVFSFRSAATANGTVVFEVHAPSLEANSEILQTLGTANGGTTCVYIGFKSTTGRGRIGTWGCNDAMLWEGANTYLANTNTIVSGTLQVSGLTTINNKVRINPNAGADALSILYPSMTSGSIYAIIGKSIGNDESAAIGYLASSKKAFIGVTGAGDIITFNSTGVEIKRNTIIQTAEPTSGWHIPLQVLGTNEAYTGGSMIFPFGYAATTEKCFFITYNGPTKTTLMGVWSHPGLEFGCSLLKGFLPTQFTNTLTIDGTTTMNNTLTINTPNTIAMSIARTGNNPVYVSMTGLNGKGCNIGLWNPEDPYFFINPVGGLQIRMFHNSKKFIFDSSHEAHSIDLSANLASGTAFTIYTNGGGEYNGILAINTSRDQNYSYATASYAANMTTDHKYLHAIGKSASSLKAACFGYKEPGLAFLGLLGDDTTIVYSNTNIDLNKQTVIYGYNASLYGGSLLINDPRNILYGWASNVRAPLTGTNGVYSTWGVGNDTDQFSFIGYRHPGQLEMGMQGTGNVFNLTKSRIQSAVPIYAPVGGVNTDICALLNNLKALL